MAHIQINVGDGAASVLLDGTDITQSIAADSLSVDVRDGIFGGKSLVHLTLLADVLGIDIEDVAFDAEKVEAPRRICDEPVV